MKSLKVIIFYKDASFWPGVITIKIWFTRSLSQNRTLWANQHPSTVHWFCNNCRLAVDYDFHIPLPLKYSLCLFCPPPSPAVPSSMRPVTPPSRCHWWIHSCTPLWVWLWTGSNTTCTGPTPETNPSPWPQWTPPRGASSSTPTWVNPGA